MDYIKKGQVQAKSNSETAEAKSCLSAPTNMRKLRTYSYRRAINTPPKIVVGEPLKEGEQNGLPQSNSSNELHYQQIAEKGLLNDTVEEDSDSEVKRAATLKHPSRPSTTMGQRWTSQPRLQGGLLVENMDAKEKKRQEAMFELITSESSYLRSLSVLVNYFMKSQELRSSITSTEYHHLFSNVESVRKTSKRFFSALERRRKSSTLVIDDVCDIVSDFVTSGAFEPYITYCSNESFQQKALQSLMNDNPIFTQVLRQLESGKECASLPLHSFLLLPMQRITRLPLLIDSIRQRCDVTMRQYRSSSLALRETSKLVKICNDRAKSLERTEQMVQLQKQLEFKSSTRSFALISSSRYLLKRGPMIKVGEEVVLGFRRVSRQEIYLFLFNDVLLLTKKKSNDLYSVIDFCYKDRLRARDVINDICSFILAMDNNQEGEEVEVRLEADKPNTKARWMMALENSNYAPKITKEKMQVEIIRSSITNEPDMTSLKLMDVYVVLNTTPDGWIYGERLSDGCHTWFPSIHGKEILSEKVRERNLQRRRRLLGEQTLI